jgi:hypothetical protein
LVLRSARYRHEHLSANGNPVKTKPLRDIVQGETFRPAGSPYWQRSTGDAQADTQRGICVVSCQPLGEMRGLGHLVCEVQQ